SFVMAENTISKTEELAVKLQAEKQIKVIEAKKAYDNSKAILNEQFHKNLSELQAKLQINLESVEISYQNVLKQIDEQYN
ncbi:MAG: hypothetical protein LBV53_02570, partial [Mycoplasmataceae bacterium]|nr:hypothetical protein [Mycoplasmataceae bacterium]